MKINLESREFQEELKKTTEFANQVCEKNNFYPNPIEEENTRIYKGLAQNKIKHGKRYCPCFMVIGKTKEEKSEADNRACPCVPALEQEIPNDGRCHCGIFCTEEYVEKFKEKPIKNTTNTMEEKNTEISKLLHQEEINGNDLMSLLDAREKGEGNFLLIDVREESEYNTSRIVGVDYLIPTSSFYEKIKIIESEKETPIILQCHSGGRSYQAQQLMKQKGYKNVINLAGGISMYSGETENN